MRLDHQAVLVATKRKCICLRQRAAVTIRRRRTLLNSLLRWIWSLVIRVSRRLSSRYSLVAFVFLLQTFLLINTTISYRAILLLNSSRSLDDDVDDVECRRRFLTAYEDYCRHSLRPLPYYYLQSISQSSSPPESSSNNGTVEPPTSMRNTSAAMELCPCIPTDIETETNVDVNKSASWDDIVRRHSQDRSGRGQLLTLGGRWRPTWCVPRHRVAIIVPFKGRDHHLTVFVDHLFPVLRRQLLDFTIFVVEQVSPEVFNRGALLNAGYIEAKARASSATGDRGEFDCFIFHDVDLFPESGFNFYVCSQMPRHMASYRESWNYTKLYPKFFGGVNAFRDEHFERINGFSNKFYGWGGEDDDLLNRVAAVNLTVNTHYPKCVSRYAEAIHERDMSNPTGIDKYAGLRNLRPVVCELLRDNGLDFRPKDYPLDGLNSLNYTVTDHREMSLYTKLLVSLPESPYSLEALRKAQSEDINDAGKKTGTLSVVVVAMIVTLLPIADRHWT